MDKPKLKNIMKKYRFNMIIINIIKIAKKS